MVKIKAKDGNTFNASDSNGYKYLQFDVYNKDASASGTDPFVALVDANGTSDRRMGKLLLTMDEIIILISRPGRQ